MSAVVVNTVHQLLTELSEAKTQCKSGFREMQVVCLPSWEPGVHYNVLQIPMEEHVPDDILSGLNNIFHGTLLAALDLVDKKGITKLIAASGREFYQVKGTSGVPYTCLSSSNYCSCPSYVYSVLLKKDSLMCKHVLAMHLAIALDQVCCRSITDEEFVAFLSPYSSNTTPKT